MSTRKKIYSRAEMVAELLAMDAQIIDGTDIFKQAADMIVQVCAWTQATPKESGLYWHWNGDPDCGPNPLSVMWSGGSDKAFVARGQYGIEEAIDCDVFGGWWMPLENPLTPAELD